LTSATPRARPLLLATTNRDKILEIREMLADVPYAVHALDDVESVAAPEETGTTFAENARLKALYYANASGLLTVAEDSGLEVDALDGAPGVYSARFGEPDAVSYPDKFALLRARLRERGVETSTARFTCALALADKGAIVFEASGYVEGEIASEARGREGFGYDPIFFYPPFHKTFGEVPRREKATVSHRARAFAKLRALLVANPDLADKM
jgi:XTP/dITP diphosphohydrolase